MHSPPVKQGDHQCEPGPSGNLSTVLFCEKEGFSPLFKAVNLANRYDLILREGVP
jgi:hypothetical protein